MSDHQSYVFETLETFKDILEKAHDLIHIVEPDGRIIYVNAAWEKLLGYSQEEMLGVSIYSLLDAKTRGDFRIYRESILQGALTDKAVTISFIGKSGNTVHAEGIISLHTLNDRTVYTCGIFRDVTARLNNEAKIRSKDPSY